MKFKLIDIFISLVLLIYSFKGYGEMFDFIKPYKLELSPEISGRIIKLGEPVENIEVSLLTGLNKSYEKSVFTDQDGKFYFQPIIQDMWLKPSPINTNVIGIQITAKFNGNNILLWLSHSGLVLHDYIKDNLNNLECDINDPEFEYHFKNRVVENGVDPTFRS